MSRQKVRGADWFYAGKDNKGTYMYSPRGRLYYDTVRGSWLQILELSAHECSVLTMPIVQVYNRINQGEVHLRHCACDREWGI